MTVICSHGRNVGFKGKDVQGVCLECMPQEEWDIAHKTQLHAQRIWAERRRQREEAVLNEGGEA